jgi:hypothetical protein
MMLVPGLQDGIVVVSKVIPEALCDDLRHDMERWLQRRGIEVNDNATWHRYSGAYLEMSPTILGMMNTGASCFSM